MNEKLKMTPLPKTGYYELTRDIANPKPDRRSKSWDKQPVLVPRRVYVRITPDRMREDVCAELGLPVLVRFRVEIGVGYDNVVAFIDGDGAVVTDLDDYPTIGAVVEAWNAGAFTFDDSVAAYLQVAEREQYITMTDVIEQLVARDFVSRRELDLVLDFVRARDEARYEEEAHTQAQAREDKLRERLNDADTNNRN